MGQLIGKSINWYRLIDFFHYRFELVNIDYRDLLCMRTSTVALSRKLQMCASDSRVPLSHTLVPYSSVYETREWWASHSRGETRVYSQVHALAIALVVNN